jgi:hypothetical protein
VELDQEAVMQGPEQDLEMEVEVEMLAHHPEGEHLLEEAEAVEVYQRQTLVELGEAPQGLKAAVVVVQEEKEDWWRCKTRWWKLSLLISQWSEMFTYLGSDSIEQQFSYW